MANDAYEVYFAEKLWELLPAMYRDRDGRAETPGQLRALIEIWAREAARLRRSQDQLWDNAYIEMCEDWAVPYIGALVADRPLSALNPRGARISVAKAVHYRRRAGTRLVLEELITDIAGHEGIVTEGFRRLARAWHRLDVPPVAESEAQNPTPPGGMADLRSPRRLDLALGPFDSFAYHPDLRRSAAQPVPGRAAETVAPLARLDGGLDIAGIRKVGFHLFRLNAWMVSGVAPASAGLPTRFRADPSGRDIPLFQLSTRASGGNQGLTGTGFPDWRAATEWEVPAPMRCRVLGHALYAVSEASLVALAVAPGFDQGRRDQIARLLGQRFEGEAQLRRGLNTLADRAFFLQTAALANIRAATLRPECGKHALVPGSLAIHGLPDDPLPPTRLAAGSLATWAATIPGRRVVVDPERGRLRFLNGAPPAGLRVDYTIGAPGPIGAGPWLRPEAAARTPDIPVSGGGNIGAAMLPATGITEIGDSDSYDVTPQQTTVRDLTVQAAGGERPYLRRADDWILLSGGANASLTLDGLWIGGDAPRALRLRGSYGTVRLAHVTLDPGGNRDAEGLEPPVPPVVLVVAGEIDRLEIDHCVLGRIRTRAAGQIKRLVIRDSILQSPPSGAPVIALDAGEVILERVTLMGDSAIHRLYATETLSAGTMTVRDVQAGCFRFGAYGQGSRLPKRYQSHALPPGVPPFTVTRFGEAAYGQLAPGAPDFLHEGAELGSEIGAFSSLNLPIRLRGLAQKAEEFMPFGLLPFYIGQT